MNDRELGWLIDECLEGSLSEADMIRLEAELATSEAARRAYTESVRLNVLLQTVAEEKVQARGLGTLAGSTSKHIDTAPASSGQQAMSARWKSVGFWAALACGTALLVFLTRGVPSDRSLPTENRMRLSGQNADIEPEEAELTGFAVVARQLGAKWADKRLRRDGELLGDDWLHLSEGVIQLELFSGVNLVVEGEARFKVASSMRLELDRGKLRAEVPDTAKGFQVVTANGIAHDLGTIFAVDTNEDLSRVHVVDGLVRWEAGDDKQLLRTGEMVQRGGSRTTQVSDLTEIAFVSSEDFLSQLHDLQTSKRARWDAAMKHQLEDPDLKLVYDLSGESAKRRLNNLADVGFGEGAIVGAQRTTNRFGVSSSALDFSAAGSRVRTQVVGELEAMTLACWVKIYSLDRRYNSLFLTDGHDLNEPHWQLLRDGRIFFSVKKNDEWDPTVGEKDKHIFHSPSIWSPSQSGRWMFLTTVYDTNAQLVSHYVDGHSVSREEIPAGYLVPRINIGNASIGNWSEPERDEASFAVRNLNGAMDLFLLYGRALNETEVAAIYDASSPEEVD